MKLAFGSFLQVARLAFGDDSTDYEGDVLCDVKTGSKINCSPGDVGLTVPLCAFPPEAITDPYMVNEACVGNVVGDNLGRFSKISRSLIGEFSRQCHLAISIWKPNYSLSVKW